MTQRDSGTSRSVRSVRSSSVGDRGEVGVAADERGSSLGDGAADAPPSASSTPVSSKTSRMAATYAAIGELRFEVPAERGRGSCGDTTDRATSRGSASRGIHPAAGEDVHVGRERHRGRTPGQQDLEPGTTRTEQDDGRGEPGNDARVGHPGEVTVAPDAASSARSASGSVTGSRQTNPRQT